jgi:hypothetical protein
MCGQLHDDPPYIESIYKVGELADSNTVKLAKYFEINFIQNMIGQHALWAYTDKAELNELEKYGADSLTIVLTKNILNNLSIKTNLNTLKQTVIAMPDNTIKVSKIIIYCVAGLLLILLIAIIFLFFRKRKHD